MTGDITRRIRERAHEIWESEGRPDGRAEDHWRQAQAELNEVSAQTGQEQEVQSPAATSAAGKPKRRRSAGSAAPSKDAGASTGRTSAAKAPRQSRRKKPEG